MGSENKKDSVVTPGVVVYVLAVLFLTFMAGVMASVFSLWPYPQLRNSVQAAFDVWNGVAHEGPHFLHPQRYAETGVRVYDADKTQAGPVLVGSMWEGDSGWGARLRLMERDGAVTHEWFVNPERIWPDAEHPFDPGAGEDHPFNYVHGAWLLPDGDVVFNIEYLGLARLNACSEVVWSLPIRTHHSVFRGDDGNFWVSGMYLREQPDIRFPQVWEPFVEDMLVQVSPDGEVLREISTLAALYESGYQGVLSTPAKLLNWDFNHLNDVEELSAELAPAFPMFNPGDLLISLRNFNLVVVVDGKTEKIKWHFRHPLIRQHDPDFEPDGRIVIFDNNDDTTADGRFWGRSRLISVDPATKDYEVIYPLAAETEFYTQTAGKHQLLPNGNRLIIEANAGRLFEVTPDGDIVWDWVTDQGAEGKVAEVMEGNWYDPAGLNISCDR